MLNSKFYISINLPAQWAVSITTHLNGGKLDLELYSKVVDWLKLYK